MDKLGISEMHMDDLGLVWRCQLKWRRSVVGKCRDHSGQGCRDPGTSDNLFTSEVKLVVFFALVFREAAHLQSNQVFMFILVQNATVMATVETNDHIYRDVARSPVVVVVVIWDIQTSEPVVHAEGSPALTGFFKGRLELWGGQRMSGTSQDPISGALIITTVE